MILERSRARAIDQAILADPDVCRRNRESIIINMGRVVAELKDAGLYGSLPEQSVLAGFLLLFNMLEGIIHRARTGFEPVLSVLYKI